MRRVVIIGTMLALCLCVSWWQLPRMRQSVPGLRPAVSTVSSTTMAPVQPIPAMPSTPRLAVPIWSLYAGSASCLLIAAIMLWRCRMAGQCLHTRKTATRPWQH